MNFGLTEKSSGECCVCFDPLIKSLEDYGYDVEHNLRKHIVHNKCLKIFEETLEKQVNSQCPWCKIIDDTNPSGVKINNKRMFNKILTNDSKITKSDSFPLYHKKEEVCFYDEQVKNAVHSNQHEAVREFLNRGAISNKTCGLLIIEATKKNSALVIQELCKGRKKAWEHIPYFALNEALRIAEENTYEGIVALLKPIQEQEELHFELT